MLSWRTNDEMLVCLKYWLRIQSETVTDYAGPDTYARTLANSFDGDMTKLSSAKDHEIRCASRGSSSMLGLVSHMRRPG